MQAWRISDGLMAISIEDASLPRLDAGQSAR
jgi:hypothetical protein